MAFGLMGGLALVSTVLFKVATSHQNSMDGYVGWSVYRNRLEYYFNDSRSVQNTIENNATMACLTDSSTNCSPGATRSFEVFNSSTSLATPTEVVKDFRQGANWGFTLKGQTCDTFPSDLCVFQYRTTWTPICGNDAVRCRTPSYRLTGELFSSLANPPFRLDLLKVEVVRSASGEQLAQICQSIGGEMDGKACIMPLGAECLPNTYFVGIKPDKKKRCVGIAAVSCPLGTVIMAIDSAGEVTCGPGCYTTALTCKFNMWTGVTNCPIITWVSGTGIMGSGAYGASPYSSDGGDGN